MIDLLSAPFRLMPDARRPDRVDYSLHATLLSGFAMLCFQHPSLWEFQRKMPQRRGRVAYLLAADKYSGPLASWLIDTNQPVIRTRNAFSTLRLTQLVCI